MKTKTTKITSLLLALVMLFSAFGGLNITALADVPTVNIVATRMMKSGVTVYWEKLSDVSGYQIEYSYNKDMSNSKTQKVNKLNTHYKIKSEKHNTIYYRIRAYLLKNEVETYYKWSSIETAVLPKDYSNYDTGKKTLIYKNNGVFNNSFKNYTAIIGGCASFDSIFIIEYKSSDYPIKITSNMSKEEYCGNAGAFTAYVPINNMTSYYEYTVSPYTESGLAYKNTQWEINIYEITPLVNIKSVNRNNTHAKITWNAANADAKIDGYYLQWSETFDYKSYKQQDLGKGSLSCAIDGLDKYKDYYARVIPYKKVTVNGKDVIHKYMLENVGPCLSGKKADDFDAYAQITNSKRKKKAIWVKWAKVSDVKGYQIQYSTKKNMKGSKKLNTSKNAKTIKRLKKKKAYYVRVRAYRVVHGKTYYSPWSNKVKIKTK